MVSQHSEMPVVVETLGLIGQSEALHQVLESVTQVAPTQITVLITGESGTGKEMVARAIHKLSSRKDRPMLTVNCGAIPEGILESELFGHEKGAFTGASDSRKGYFELADHGTLFLDEIGEMPLGTQVKLLRILEAKEFLRVGGTISRHVDVRMLAATNKDLELAVKRGEFRKDLFYRLNAVKIRIPPLRERREDIRLLVVHFTDEICRTNRIDFKGFTEEAFRLMENQAWPGNIRQLRNTVERVIILEKGRLVDLDVIRNHLERETETERHLPVVASKPSDQTERELLYHALLEIRMAIEELRTLILQKPSVAAGRMFDGETLAAEVERGSFETEDKAEPVALKDMERIQIERTLEKFGGNRRKSALALKIGERTLYRKLKEFDIEKP